MRWYLEDFFPPFIRQKYFTLHVDISPPPQRACHRHGGPVKYFNGYVSE